MTHVLAVQVDLTHVLAVQVDVTYVLAVQVDVTHVLAVQAEVTTQNCRSLSYACAMVEENTTVYTEGVGYNNVGCLNLTLTRNCQPGQLGDILEFG